MFFLRGDELPVKKSMDNAFSDEMSKHISKGVCGDRKQRFSYAV
jgi:hypothetical protein